jgi:hypothetical protein
MMTWEIRKELTFTILFLMAPEGVHSPCSGFPRRAVLSTLKRLLWSLPKVKPEQKSAAFLIEYNNET